MPGHAGISGIKINSPVHFKKVAVGYFTVKETVITLRNTGMRCFKAGFSSRLSKLTIISVIILY